ncbi:hypothetical protein ABFX02_14G180500 [Erythranthe guttata]
MAPKSKKMNIPSGPGSGSSGRSKSKKPYDDEIISLPMEDVRTMTDNFALANKCGGGSYATVFKAEYTSPRTYHTKMVAVKRILNTTRVRPEYEIEALTILKPCPQIISLIGTSRDSESCCLVLDYVRRNLEDFIKEEGDELSWARTLNIIKQVAYAVKAIVEKGYVNSDIKPNNILIDDMDNVYLCDFGSARKEGKDLPTLNELYTPREISNFGTIDPEKVDLYSLGVLILQLIMKNNIFGRLCLGSSLKHEVKYGENTKNAILHISVQARIHMKNSRIKYVVHKKLFQSGCTVNDAIAVTELGIRCTEENPNSRPTIDEVIAVLGNLM